MLPEAQVLIHLVAIWTAAAAGFTDLRTRRIPNSLVLIALAGGLCLNAFAGGALGVLRSLAGAGLGLALFLPFFVLGGMGGGDVKLLAALGSLVGPLEVVQLALVTALLGGALAVAVAAWEKRLASTCRSVVSLLSFWIQGGLKPSPEVNLERKGALKIPYAVPVAFGTLAVVLLRWN
jgi:prepilin peptidase CpaA